MSEAPRPEDPACTTPEEKDERAAPARSCAWLFWPAGLLVLIADLASKYAVFAYDDPHAAWGEHALIRPALNKGVAWSIGASNPVLVQLGTLVLIPILIAVYWLGFRPKAGRIEHIAFGMIIGGALGNAWDRVIAFAAWDPGITGVRDFIHVDLGFPPFDPWPTFNIADMALTGAVAGLIVYGFFKPRKSDRR